MLNSPTSNDSRMEEGQNPGQEMTRAYRSMNNMLDAFSKQKSRMSRGRWCQAMLVCVLAVGGCAGGLGLAFAGEDGLLAERFGNWKCQVRGDLMDAQGDSASTRQFKQRLISRGLTRIEAQHYLNVLLRTPSESLPSERCEAAAQLWLPHLIDCEATPIPSASQGDQPVIEWSSVRKGLAVALLDRRITWGELLKAHRKVAQRKGQLPVVDESWRIGSAVRDGRTSLEFRMITTGALVTNDSSSVKLLWDQGFLPEGESERSWACLRVASSIAVATEGMIPMEVQFCAPRAGAESPLRIEIIRKGKTRLDVSQVVSPDLNQASVVKWEDVPRQARVTDSLERSIDRLLIEILKALLDS